MSRASEWSVGLATFIPRTIKAADDRNFDGVYRKDTRRDILVEARRKVHALEHAMVSANKTLDFPSARAWTPA